MPIEALQSEMSTKENRGMRNEEFDLSFSLLSNQPVIVSSEPSPLRCWITHFLKTPRYHISHGFPNNAKT